MGEYIKREDAINEIKRFDGYLDDDMICRINIALKRIPAADVEPVKHGHWECSDDIYETAICSECGCNTEESYGFVTNSDEYNFCRNCGAKMNKEQEHVGSESEDKE